MYACIAWALTLNSEMWERNWERWEKIQQQQQKKKPQMFVKIIWEFINADENDRERFILKGTRAIIMNRFLLLKLVQPHSKENRENAI